ncbi:MAG: enoyl-CoA hydratase/isomerase family protein [Chloroflexi bacterium]|nr:enoyl-CoA hydratase/isomerase family protein [Chloroflexota bacterium]
MPYENVLYEVKGRIAYITLNRPQSLNAFNDPLESEVVQALREFDLEDEAWVAIISGAGRCFSAGADVKQRFAGTTRQERRAAVVTRGGGVDGFLGRTANWKPVIAAVHSYCLGVACSLTAECDLIVAAEDAQFGITELKRGIQGATIWARLWPNMASKVAAEMVLTGDPISAQEAYRMGLVNRLVPKGQHVAGAEKLAERLMEVPPLAVRSSVRMLRFAPLKLVADAELYARALRLNLTEDFEESAKAFVEKRKPVYKGR